MPGPTYDPSKPYKTLAQITEQLQTQWSDLWIADRDHDGVPDPDEVLVREGRFFSWTPTTINYAIMRTVTPPLDTGSPGAHEIAEFARGFMDSFGTDHTLYETAVLSFELWDDLIRINLVEAPESKAADIVEKKVPLITFAYTDHPGWDAHTPDTDNT